MLIGAQRWGLTNVDEQELVPTVVVWPKRSSFRLERRKSLCPRLRVQIFLEPRPTTSSPERIAEAYSLEP